MWQFNCAHVLSSLRFGLFPTVSRKNAATSAHFPPAKSCASTHARSTQTAADAEDLTHIADAGINKGINKGRASVPQYTQGAARCVRVRGGWLRIINPKKT
jgi:hypothetical protein